MDMFQGRKVVIIDSSSFIRQALCAEFKAMDAEPYAEIDSDAGLLKIIHTRPDLIITGVEVGRITGYDLCLILKLMPDYAGIPIVIISSSDNDVVMHKASDAGADYYLHKDDHVIARIHEIARTIGPRSATGPAPVTPRHTIQSVLVVDDSRIMRKVITNILRSIQIVNITEAEDGVDGLDRLKTHTFDLIMTDWNMPRMNGLEMIREIRKHPQHALTPIAMVTTESGMQDMAEARAAGATDHLCKPFSVEGMHGFIRRLSSSV